MIIKKTKKSPYLYQRGQAMLLAVILFLFISSVIVFGIANPILKQVHISQDLTRSKQSYYLAEGSLEDAIYRIKNVKKISSGDTNTLNGYTSTISLITSSNSKTIDVTSN